MKGPRVSLGGGGRRDGVEGFSASHRCGSRSRPANEPAMMVSALLYAYARGIRSSRVIERPCAFRVVAAQQRPSAWPPSGRDARNRLAKRACSHGPPGLPPIVPCGRDRATVGALALRRER
jgi:hypothetical protein